MTNNPYKVVPTWDKGVWTTTVYDTREQFRDYIMSQFKEPGQYNFDETSLLFNAQAKLFVEQNESYCLAPFRSRDYVNYWDFEKTKCIQGVIFRSDKGEWYLPRDYYMWVNFLRIFDKIKNRFAFAEVWDVQLHIALYELKAELNSRHASIFKKRQIASSYFHAAKLINQLWFEEGITLKIGASESRHVDMSGTWAFLEEYRDFLNSNTAWYRPMNPGKVKDWQQKIDVDQNGRTKSIGNKGKLIGMSFEQTPTKGVGGPCRIFFYEEAGIAPTLDQTFEFIRPALNAGAITTGLFIAAGSVGKLTECEPLKELTLHPVANGIEPVTSNLIDETGVIGESGLFIPEQWGMPPYIDEFGNSQPEKALAALEEMFATWKKELKPELYQLRISQHPRNIKEGFAHRDSSPFPLAIIGDNKRRIVEHEYPYELIDLDEDLEGSIVVRKTSKLPISTFPVNPKLEDKTGSIVVWERPDEKPAWGTYYGSIDPVSEGKAEHVDNMLYTPTGKKRIGLVQTGDQVIGSNGKPINVTGVYPQGIKKMCNITFSDGCNIKVCEDHLWNVKLNGGTKDYITLSVKDLLDQNKTITYSGTGKNSKKLYTIPTYYKDKLNRNRWSIPIVKPIEFDVSKDLSINPYLLGLLLGDGGLSQKSIRFSTVDEELIISIQNLLPEDLIIQKVKNSSCDYIIKTKIGVRNSLSQKLKLLGLTGKKSKDKFIPKEYMYSSSSDRLLLLQGLMDTDGSYTNHGAEFYSSSKILAYQVVELVQSLGGIAKIRCKKTTHLDSYIVRVLLPSHLNPFILKRKRNIYKPSKVFSRYITDIQYIEDAEAVCISVDSSDNLYVTEHVIVTHNTTTSESLCSIYIYKNAIEVTRITENGPENFIEGDKIVAAWCGRYDDINMTHKRLRLLIEWYNAWTLIENNITLFINYMVAQRKQKYLVPKDQVVFLKELQANKSVYQDYGWKNVGVIFKSHLLNYLIEWVSEVIDNDVAEDGTIINKRYGVTRIPDIMAMEEMEAYRSGVNVDRLVSLAALVAFAKIQQANRGYAKRVENQTGKDLEKSANLYKLESSPFRNIGKGKLPSGNNKNRSPYKNLR